ncbi:MAG TPA: sulfatase-like hydrolase/transferase, partial [Candidatus Saccharimonadales bacterium]|nr:sulfatase-like hydrolase/transferase [Candidatus Saccharimonadales bacterium]
MTIRFLAVLLATLVLPELLRGAEATRPLNILFIITDDQRFDQMGNMNPMLHTPEMDRLAREGVRFENAFVTTPICAASRASMLCGMVERTHRYTFKTPPLAEQFLAASFPKLLKDAGYHTGYVGKFGVTTPTNAIRRLYDEFHETKHPYWQKQKDGSLRHLTDLEGDFAIQFLEEHLRARNTSPFCLTIGFNAPHADDPEPQQYFWQKEVDDLYRDVKVPPPPCSDPDFYDHLPEFLRDG